MKCVSDMQWCKGVWLITVTGGGKWKYDRPGPVGVNFQEWSIFQASSVGVVEI
jgi:hypothetical protein